METTKVFLTKIKKAINAGEYDSYLTMPFMTRKLISSAIEGKIQRLIESDGTPILTESEIKKTIEDARETAAITYHVFKDHKFLEVDEEGNIGWSKKGELALKVALRMD